MKIRKTNHTNRLEGYRKIIEAREDFLKAGILANDIFKESKKQLEKRPKKNRPNQW